MKNNILLINSLLNKQAKQSYQNNHFGERHVIAFRVHPIGKMISALAQYAQEHFKKYDSALSEDYILGKAWIDALKNIRVLLNGELDGMDGGFTDEIILAVGKNCGFKEKEF